MTVRVGLYLRISKDRAGNMIGVARQEEDCRRRAAEKGWDVVEVYVENDTSAYRKKSRPQWNRLLADVRSRAIDALLAQHPDRFNKGGRDLEDLIDAVESTGCLVDTVDYHHYDLSTRSGRTLARLIGVVARDESEAKAERYANKHAELARKGRWKGGPRPYGYDVARDTLGRPLKDGRLMMLDCEAVVVREAAERALSGETLYSICRDFNERGVTTAQNALWRVPTLHRILTGSTHAGKRVFHGEVVADAVWPAIIDEVTHRRLRMLLIDHHRAVGPRARVFLLSGGYARCGLCGSRLIGQRRESGARTYVCLKGPGGNGCGGIHCVAEPLEALIVEVLMLRLDTHELAEALDRRTSESPENTAEADLARAEAKLEELAAMYAADQISAREWTAARGPVAKERQHAEDRLRASYRQPAVARWTRPGALRAAWPDMSLDQRRAVLDLIVERVVVNPTKVRGRFDPDRIDVIWRL